MGVPRLTPVVRGLVIALFAIYVLELVLQNQLGWPVLELLGFAPARLGYQTVWQLVTHVAVSSTSPDQVAWVLISLVFVWLMLSPFEQQHGPTRTIQLCLAATLGASLPALLLGLAGLAPGRSMLAGTSPLTLAAVAAFAIANRNGVISLFGVLPIKAMVVLIVEVVYVVLVFLSSSDPVLFVGSLGAIGAGVGFMRFIQTRSRPKSVRPTRGGASPSLRVVKGGADDKADEKKPKPPKWLN